MDTCSPKTVSNVWRSPPGSGLAAAALELSSRRWEPALCPQTAGSRSVDCGSLFHAEQNNKTGSLNISLAQTETGTQVFTGTSWAQVSCTHMTFGPRPLLVRETLLLLQYIWIMKIMSCTENNWSVFSKHTGKLYS